MQIYSILTKYSAYSIFWIYCGATIRIVWITKISVWHPIAYRFRHVSIIFLIIIIKSWRWFPYYQSRKLTDVSAVALYCIEYVYQIVCMVNHSVNADVHIQAKIERAEKHVSRIVEDFLFKARKT